MRNGDNSDNNYYNNLQGALIVTIEACEIRLNKKVYSKSMAMTTLKKMRCGWCSCCCWCLGLGVGFSARFWCVGVSIIAGINYNCSTWQVLFCGAIIHWSSAPAAQFSALRIRSVFGGQTNWLANHLPHPAGGQEHVRVKLKRARRAWRALSGCKEVGRAKEEGKEEGAGNWAHLWVFPVTGFSYCSSKLGIA